MAPQSTPKTARASSHRGQIDERQRDNGASGKQQDRDARQCHNQHRGGQRGAGNPQGRGRSATAVKFQPDRPDLPGHGRGAGQHSCRSQGEGRNQWVGQT